jgi:hypothetical protein
MAGTAQEDYLKR